MKAPFPRKRYRDNRQSMLFKRTISDNSVVPPTVTNATYQSSPYGMFEEMNDIVTPNYKAISAAGGIVNNPMTRVSQETFYSPTSMTTTSISPPAFAGKYIIQDTGQYGGLLDYYISNLSLRARAIDLVDRTKHAKLAAIQARGNISKDMLQGLVSLAELPKTLSLVGQSVKTLYQVIKGVKTGNAQMVINAIGRPTKKFDGRTWLSRSAGNRWLEFRYGWTPLVMEVQGALKILNKAQAIKPRVTARGRSLETRNTQTSYNYDQGPAGVETFSFDLHDKVEVRAWCLYTADLKYQSARDFGLTELPLAAWELVPFSFVADWFVQVGDWLKAVTPKLGIEILAEGYTIRSEKAIYRQLASYAAPAPHPTATRYSISGNSVDDYFVETKVSRVRGLGFLLASPPPVNVKLNIKRTVDAIALLKALADK